MNISAHEIESVKTIGQLHGEDVKVLKTYGGYHIAMGLKNKKSKKPEALAAGAHIALVAHQVEKQNPEFQAKLTKSEKDSIGQVVEIPLKKSLSDLGYDLYTINKHNTVDIVVTKFNITDAVKITGLIHGSELLLSPIQKNESSLTNGKEIADEILKVIDSIAKKNNVVARFR